MNLAEAKLVRDQGPALVFADYKVPLEYQSLRGRDGLDSYVDKDLIIGLRPSSLEDAAFSPQDWPRIKGEVAVTEELGSEVNLIFHVKAPQVHHDVMIARFDKAAKDEVEAEELAGEGHSLWTARVNPKTQSRVGRSVELAIDTGGFHFFDKDTGHAIGHPDSTSHADAGGDGNGSYLGDRRR
jgi:multiple sugar transport system ATP-binding protein